MSKPVINVTPLIDVLLVLLIIFMVVSPLKPSDFKARIPQKPQSTDTGITNPRTLVVTLNTDSTLSLNGNREYGTVADPQKLIDELKAVFQQRKENGVFSENLANSENLSIDEKIEMTVFIKAPKGVDYGSVAKIIDAVKVSGANPISLQIDNLEN